MGTKAAQPIADPAPAFQEADLAQTADVPVDIERFEVGETPEEPTELNTDTLGLAKPAAMASEAEYYDESPVFEHKGGGVASAAKEPNAVGLGGFDIQGIGAGPAVKGRGGVGVGAGAGRIPAAAARAGDSAGAAAATARPCWPAAAAPSNRSGPWPPP